MINCLPLEPAIDEQSPDEDERQALLVLSQPPGAVAQDGRLLFTCRLPTDPMFWKATTFLMITTGATTLSGLPGKMSCRKVSMPVMTRLMHLVVPAMKMSRHLTAKRASCNFILASRAGMLFSKARRTSFTSTFAPMQQPLFLQSSTILQMQQLA